MSRLRSPPIMAPGLYMGRLGDSDYRDGSHMINKKMREMFKPFSRNFEYFCPG